MSNQTSHQGFYGIYRVLFDTISQSEYYATAPHGEPALSTPPSHYPSFGISTTSYDAPESGLRSFYNAYLNFSSRRAFAEVDKYRLSDAPDRRVKRLMEKENKRARDDARREYNDAVRNLAQFVKKRDPRFLTSQSKDPLKVQQLERERQRNKLRQAAVEAAKEREANARQFQAQSWQRVDAEISDDDSDEDDEENADDGGSGADGSDADFVEDDTNGSLDGRSEDGIGDETEDDEINDFFCPACEKQFASQGAWDNHEQSKKHLKNMQRLKKQMQAEDSELGLSGGVAGVDLTGSSTPSGPPDVEGEDGLPRMSNKEKKRLKKKFGIDLHAALDDAADLEPAPLETSEKSEHRRATQETPPADSVTTEGDEAGHSNDVEELALDRAETPAAEDRQQQAETKPELSKREKRRMKEAAKKASGTSTPGEVRKYWIHYPESTAVKESDIGTFKQSCNVCGATFPSRSKLFDHIAEEGHAAAREVTSKGKASSKKGKKR